MKIDLRQLLCYLFSDPDGDHVSFSTDEELMEALGFVSDSVFKIYITLRGMCVRAAAFYKQNYMQFTK